MDNAGKKEIERTVSVGHAKLYLSHGQTLLLSLVCRQQQNHSNDHNQEKQVELMCVAAGAG
jgi:hypothetical protein